MKITGQSEDDRDLGTRSGGDVNGLGLDLRPWVYGERGNWSAYAMGQAVAATDTIETDTLRQNDDGTSTDTGDDSRQPDKSYLAMREFWVATAALPPTQASNCASVASACAATMACGAIPTSKR